VKKGPFKRAAPPLSAVEGLRRPVDLAVWDASIAGLDGLSQAGLLGDNHHRMEVGN
jgi:hypothetical protein